VIVRSNRSSISRSTSPRKVYIIACRFIARWMSLKPTVWNIDFWWRTVWSRSMNCTIRSRSRIAILLRYPRKSTNKMQWIGKANRNKCAHTTKIQCSFSCHWHKWIRASSYSIAGWAIIAREILDHCWMWIGKRKPIECVLSPAIVINTQEYLSKITKFHLLTLTSHKK